MQFTGQRLAVSTPGAGLPAMEESMNRWLAPNVEQMRQKNHVPPVADFISHGSLVDGVADRRGGDGTIQVQGRLKERAFEWQYAGTASTCSFGKEDHEQIVVEGGAHLFRYCRHADTALLIDENRTAKSRAAAENRPCADLHLGNEYARSLRCNKDDVDIAEVICDKKTSPWERAAGMNSQVQDLGTPGRNALQPFGACARLSGTGVQNQSARTTDYC